MQFSDYKKSIFGISDQIIVFVIPFTPTGTQAILIGRPIRVSERFWLPNCIYGSF